MSWQTDCYAVLDGTRYNEYSFVSDLNCIVARAKGAKGTLVVRHTGVAWIQYSNGTQTKESRAATPVAALLKQITTGIPSISARYLAVVAYG